jgi:hypothetical protein
MTLSAKSVLVIVALVAATSCLLPAGASAHSVTLAAPTAGDPAGNMAGYVSEVIHGTVTPSGHGDCGWSGGANYIQTASAETGHWIRDKDETHPDGSFPPSYEDSAQPAADHMGEFETEVHNLLPDVIYHYRVGDDGSYCAEGADYYEEFGPSRTPDSCFKAGVDGAVPCPPAGQHPPLPVAEIGLTTDVNGDTATVHGVGDANGCSGGSNTPYFAYGAAEDGTYEPGEVDPTTHTVPKFDQVGTATPDVPLTGTRRHERTGTLTGLTPGYLYHVRLVDYAMVCYDTDGHLEPDTGDGPGYRTVASIETCFVAGAGPAPCHPASTAETLGTEAALTADAQKVTGAVHQHGCATQWWFSYGPHGGAATSSAGGTFGAGSGDSVVSETLTGLAPGTTYDVELQLIDLGDCDVGTIAHGGVRQFTPAGALAPIDLGEPPPGPSGYRVPTEDPAPKQLIIPDDFNPVCDPGNLASYDAGACTAFKAAVKAKVVVGLQSSLASVLKPLSGDLGKVVSVGSGNVVSVGSGNVVSVGAGNFAEQITGVVSVGSGNVVSVGAGNVVSVGAGNVVSVGSGNVVSVGSGNVVSVGAGNVVSVGAGNVVSVGSGGFVPQARAARAPGKAVVIAKAVHTFDHAGNARVTMRTTPAGRRLLKRLKRQAKRMRAKHRKPPAMTFRVTGAYAPRATREGIAMTTKLRVK